MKLILFFLITFVLQATAISTYGQRVTLDEKRAPITSVLKKMRAQTGYDFFYKKGLLSSQDRVTIQVKDGNFEDVLRKCLQEIHKTFTINEQIVVIKEENPQQYTPPKIIPSPAVEIEIRGKVKDENNLPIPGVTVKGASDVGANGKYNFVATTATNNDGSFVLKTASDIKFLVFSYTGLETKTVNVVRGQFLSIVMKTMDNPLDVVQIVAYGSTTKRLATGSVGSIKADQLEKQPVSNPLQAMSGRLAGVFITETSGLAGSGVNMQIRGQNTITGSKNPLYIVDGVPFSSAPTETTAGSYSPISNLGGSTSPFDNIPTSDIESIEVLKDADATAIYGTRAANGVVIITTKKGKSGASRIAINLYSGIGQIANSLKMLNTDEYLDIRRKAFANDNLTPTVANAPDLLLFGNGETDFVDKIMGNTANLTDATFNLSGGSNLTQYMVSGNYRHQSSVLPMDFANNKGTVRVNLQTKSENNKFSFNISAGYTKNRNNLPTATLSSLYALPPNLPMYNADGSYYWHNSYTNPMATLLSPSVISSENIIANATVKYDFLPNLGFKVDFGYSKMFQESSRATTKIASNPATTSTGIIIMNNNNIQTVTVEPQLNFSKEIWKGKFEALLGTSYLETTAIQPLYVLGTFASDALYNNLGSITPVLFSNSFNNSKYVSAFGRLNYNIEGKYILSLNGRRDGSSRFGPKNRFANFASAGAAWIFSEEDFIKNNLNFVSFGKLRASYGTVGVDPASDYQYLDRYSTNSIFSSYNGVSTLNPTALLNREYRWELTKKLEVAIDVNFLRDRIALTTAWYRNRSSNLLSMVPLPSQTGFTSFLGNLPALVQNKGWEFTIDTRNIVGKDFSWNTSINLSVPKNTLLQYPGLASSTYANTLVIGQPLSVVQAYHFIGFNNGIPMMQDLDGNGTFTTGSFTTTGKGDYAVVGHTDPTSFGGVNNTFNFKGFQFDFLFSFAKKKAYNIYRTSAIPGSATNVIADVLKQPFVFTTNGASTAGAAFNRYKLSDGVFEDASFIRLKNVSISYNVKENFIKHIGIKNLNVYLRGQNLLTFSKYLGFDPETLGNAIPPMRFYTIGFQTTL